MADEREDFAARSRELAGGAGKVAAPTVEEVFGPVTHDDLRRVRDELGAYVDGLAERVAAVEALGAEARQAIANAHEVEEHYDELKRRLRLAAQILAGELHVSTVGFIEAAIEVGPIGALGRLEP